MRSCISRIICLASKMIYLWRTTHKYACRNCKNQDTDRCITCKVSNSCNHARGLRNVGVPSDWESNDK